MPTPNDILRYGYAEDPPPWRNLHQQRLFEGWADDVEPDDDEDTVPCDLCGGTYAHVCIPLWKPGVVPPVLA